MDWNYWCNFFKKKLFIDKNVFKYMKIVYDVLIKEYECMYMWNKYVGKYCVEI